jgi:ParB-like nuclease domain
MLATAELLDARGIAIEKGDFVEFKAGDKFAGQVHDIKNTKMFGKYPRIMTTVPEALGWVSPDRVFKVEPPESTFEYEDYAMPQSVTVLLSDSNTPVSGIAISENRKMVRVVLDDGSTPSVPKHRIMEWLGEHVPGVEPETSATLVEDVPPIAAVLPAKFSDSLIRRDIRTDGDTQNRIAIKPDIVERYIEAIKAGKTLPPIEVVRDADGNYWLWDGFHRMDAYAELGWGMVDAIVTPGTVEDAQWLSCSANQDHGLQRTRAEMQRVVCRALRHPNSVKLSDGKIAEHVGVSGGMVAAWRLKLEERGEIEPQTTRLVERNGVTYEQDVSNIGSKSRLQTLDDLRVKYEPWGEVAHIWDAIHEFEFTQRGRVIANFRDVKNGLERFAEITSRIKKLAELPPGTSSCLICQHRNPIAGGEWKCGAKSLQLGTDTDWAKSNNGDCRLFTPHLDAMLPPSPEYIPEGVGVAEPAKKAGNSQHSSESTEHYTPSPIVEAARTLMGSIELDPFSTEVANKIVKADRILTIEDDALAQTNLEALTVYCNPPGGKTDKGRSVQAAAWDLVHNAYLEGRFEEVIYLAFSIELIAKRPVILQYPCCFTHREATSETIGGMGRIRFLDEQLVPQDAPTHANLLIYLPLRDAAGDVVQTQVEAFYEGFAPFGATGRFTQS